MLETVKGARVKTHTPGEHMVTDDAPPRPTKAPTGAAAHAVAPTAPLKKPGWQVKQAVAPGAG